MRAIRTILLILVALLILGFLFSKIEPREIYSAFLKSDKVMLALAHVFLAAVILILAGRWAMVLKLLGYTGPFKNLLFVYLAAVPVAKMLPANSGDLVKAYYLKDEVVFSKSAGGVLLEYFLDIFALLVLVVFGSLASGEKWFLYFGLFGIFALAAIFIFLKKFSFRAGGRYRDKLNSFFYIFKIFMRSREAIIILAFTFISWLAMLIYVKMLFAAFGFDIAFLSITAFQPLVTLVSLIPITLSGVGTREAAMVYFYGTLVPSPVILAVSFVYSFSLAVLLPALCLPLTLKVIKKKIQI